MNIEQAVDITSLVEHVMQVRVTTVPLSFLEEAMVKANLEEGSFNIFRVTYADDISEIYFHYPTDMSSKQALEFAESAIGNHFKEYNSFQLLSGTNYINTKS